LKTLHCKRITTIKKNHSIVVVVLKVFMLHLQKYLITESTNKQVKVSIQYIKKDR